MSDERRLRDELYAAFKNRALIYRHMFETLRAEHGEARTAEIMGRAIYARGVEIGKSFARYAPKDFAGLRDAFVGVVQDAWQPGREGCSYLHIRPGAARTR